MMTVERASVPWTTTLPAMSKSPVWLAA